MSCMLKIYTTILNNRLMKWSEKNSVLTEAQFGFSQGVGIEDAILFQFIEMNLPNNKKLYCCLWTFGRRLMVLIEIFSLKSL